MFGLQEQVIHPELVESEVSATRRVPWVENSYALISWSEMEKFAAEAFCNICANLQGLAGDFGKVQQITNKTLMQLSRQLQDIQNRCEGVGLIVSAKQIEAAIENFMPFMAEGTPSGMVHTIQVSQTLSCLQTAISSEMETHRFLRVDPQGVQYYEKGELFETKVNANFPSAKKDIKEAGTCLALDQSTACVMHLMRVLEVGLNTLARELKVLFDRRNWETIINEIEAEIKKINGPAWGPDWKQKLQFYSGAAKDFRYFKDAWRNHAMHYREHYDDSEAKIILEHVKAFMRHLADGDLKE